MCKIEWNMENATQTHVGAVLYRMNGEMLPLSKGPYCAKIPFYFKNGNQCETYEHRLWCINWLLVLNSHLLLFHELFYSHMNCMVMMMTMIIALCFDCLRVERRHTFAMLECKRRRPAHHWHWLLLWLYCCFHSIRLYSTQMTIAYR